MQPITKAGPYLLFGLIALGGCTTFKPVAHYRIFFKPYPGSTQLEGVVVIQPRAVRLAVAAGSCDAFGASDVRIVATTRVLEQREEYALAVQPASARPDGDLPLPPAEGEWCLFRLAPASAATLSRVEQSVVAEPAALGRLDFYLSAGRAESPTEAWLKKRRREPFVQIYKRGEAIRQCPCTGINDCYSTACFEQRIVPIGVDKHSASSDDHG
jgi:hypothetical protein